MSIVGLIMNLLLAVLLLAALGMGWRLNRRLKVLRDSHDGFEAAVRELNVAAARAEQGLADLRAATDEAVELLADRIEKGRALAGKLERQTDRLERLAVHSPPPRQRESVEDPMAERRLGALLAAAREARPERLTPPQRSAAETFAERAQVRRRSLDDELFADEPLDLNDIRGVRR
jgi:hypothetical protein